MRPRDHAKAQWRTLRFLRNLTVLTYPLLLLVITSGLQPVAMADIVPRDMGESIVVQSDLILF